MNLKDIALLRLKHQQVAKQQFENPADVVKWFGAMQAQDYLSALWAIGVRTKNAIETDVEKAITDRKIIRSWPLRGTLHFVAANDARWMLELSRERIHAKQVKRFKQEFDLDEKVFTRCKKILEHALRDGNQATRETLYTLLEKAKISTGSQRGLHILSTLARDGFICLGPRDGKQQTFVLLDDWIKSTKKISREESLFKLAERYFTSHGPATLQDFTWWSGLAPAEAKTGLELIKTKLQNNKIGDDVYWMATGIEIGNGNSTSIYLLPSFDEYTIAYTNRDAALDSSFQDRVFTKNGIFNPIIVINGKVSGTWKRSLKKDSVKIDFDPFSSFNTSQRKKIAIAAEQYAAFIGKQLDRQPYT